MNDDSKGAPHPVQPKHNTHRALIKSVFAALIGVQSQENRKKDFERGHASDFILYGILTVIALLITVAMIVNYVISSTA